MTFVITRSCCNDASCVAVCPADCIHPTPDEPEFGTTEMLHIDPDSCIDCGACVDHCPVAAISPDYDLPAEQSQFLTLNATWFQEPGRRGRSIVRAPVARRAWAASVSPPLRVAVVGSGPAAFFVAEALLTERGLGARVDMFERLDTPGGLVRYGVAPDHQDTRDITATFLRTTRRDGFRLLLNTTVGADVSVAELRSRYHAVVMATGASGDRALGVPGESLPGSYAARDLVGWYNGHPDSQDRSVDLSGERAVVIGNGNVALDLARILAGDVGRLSTTDIDPGALRQLRASRVREVVVAARRGAAELAASAKELLHLGSTPGLRLGAVAEEVDGARATDTLGAFKLELLRDAARRPVADATDRSVTLRFDLTPVAILGPERVTAVRFQRTAGGQEELPCGLVVRAIGHHGSAVPGLPLDDRTGTVPHHDGRVLEPTSGAASPGLYVAGWIKRGPRGVIGSNKQDARQTVAALLDDYAGGLLRDPVSPAGT